MKNVLLQRAMKLNRSRKARKGWQTAVRTLAAGVVFCTTYVLILPAITMQQTSVCGFEEHTHTDGCYAAPQAQLLGCGLDADAVVVHQHGDLCWNEAGELICTLPERTVHVHDDSCRSSEAVLACTVTHVHSEACVKTETIQICTEEAHKHTDTCYEEQTLVCEIPEAEDHAHGEGCFTVTEIPCTEPTAEDHTHEAGCYQQTDKLICGKEELQLHDHGENCRDAEGNLTCSLPVVVEHIHTEACLTLPADAAPVLTCTLQEHSHTDACYPVEGEAVISTEYHCGYAAHKHDAVCYELDGTLKCTIPAHDHDTLCLINNLDLTADVETREQWEATLEDVELTGVWAEDLLEVAKSQLGYMESKRNCILFEEELLGYTRYGAWYGNDYGKWDDMFVSFCLNYAEIDEESVPRESDTFRWITALTEKGLYTNIEGAVPAPGDLVFMDTDEDDKADFAGILAELLPENEVRIIAGDTENNCVAYETRKLTEDGILGFCDLPENPQPGEKTDVSAMLAELPDADQLQQTLQDYRLKGDKSGFEAELKDLTSRLEAIETAYNALTAEEKALVTGIEKLESLLEVCTAVTWQEIPALTTDEACVSGITETAAQILSTQPVAEGETAVLHNQDSVTYQFTAETKAHDGESTYSSARVKVELVLPLTADKAVFDTESMTWLEDSKLTVETRTIGENRLRCQVLTGVKNLTPGEDSLVVIPGSFTETVKVNVLNAAHGDRVYVQISAAMEQNDWNGTCWLHQVEEKQTLETTVFAVFNPAGMDEQQLQYETFKATIDGLIARGMSQEEAYAVGDQVQDSLDEAYAEGKLSDEQYHELSVMVIQDLIADPNTFAEAAIGNFRKREVPTPKQNYTPKAVHEPGLPVWQTVEPASTFSLRRSTSLDSNSQVDEVGGANSVDNEVYVSKTIEGTAQENVFDITLQIVTQDKIETVYNEPDMAVVIVTDISQTMNSKFTGETMTRYEAAMDSAEEFINRFQQEAGSVSRIGYVAFNTHAHKIFNLQTCNTPAQAEALAKEMRTDTDKIMDPNQDGSDADYKASHDRFTNIEGGLKMAMDMLAGVNNKNKFIVFLSDGFPTTYLKNNKDSNTTNYNGYDPYTTSGSNGTDGVFYDAVMGVHCDYGTSYSDTAAIKAREMAKKIKDKNIDIFAIGVDVAGQTIKEYHDDSMNRLKTASTVERRKTSYSGNIYEIGHWNTTSAFEDWLKGSKGSGIGSGDGYYFSSTDTSGLHAAYDEIFEKIKILNGASSHLDWVVSDPMPGMGVHEMEDVEFIAFWDLTGEKSLHESITADMDQTTNMYNENTVSFDDTTKTISWDLKKSYYGATGDEDGNQYSFRLKYRIRLQNEESDFVEGTIYDTNDVTSMGYRLIEVSDGVTVIGDRKYIEFPIPSVHGYLAELNFLKVDPLKNPVPGAEFTLSHDTESCGACRGDGELSVDIPAQVKVSNELGNVTFTRIPSGHHYILTETKVPDGYTGTMNTYNVQVSYNNLDVTVTDSKGNVLEWSGSIENGLFYQLPNTGSTGTSCYTFGGLVLIGTAALMYICISGHKRKRGGVYHRR